MPIILFWYLVPISFDGENTSKFTINIPGQLPFGFNDAADGFSSILDIVTDIITRMIAINNGEIEFSFDVSGIVIIDEIESHLHLALQKKVFSILTTLFPNIQFSVSTHSPFVLVSAENAIIYDLENQIKIEGGLSDVSYSAVVDSYFWG